MVTDRPVNTQLHACSKARTYVSSGFKRLCKLQAHIASATHGCSVRLMIPSIVERFQQCLTLGNIGKGMQLMADVFDKATCRCINALHEPSMHAAQDTAVSSKTNRTKEIWPEKSAESDTTLDDAAQSHALEGD